jgi:hypothetical protein
MRNVLRSTPARSPTGLQTTPMDVRFFVRISWFSRVQSALLWLLGVGELGR